MASFPPLCGGVSISPTDAPYLRNGPDIHCPQRDLYSLEQKLFTVSTSSLASLQIPQMVGQSIHQFCRFTSTGMHNRGVPRLPQMYNVVLPTIRVAAVGFH